MTIGIDVSQLAFENTGVSNYLRNFLLHLLEIDKKNKYILFFSSLRRDLEPNIKDLVKKPNVQIRKFKIPPTVLDILWNKLHILPIENFIGPVDIFITSDWTEPPTRHAKKATILYDLIIYKYPKGTAQKIISTQKRKLRWVRQETDKIFCISKSTAEDASQILGLSKEKLKVIYPGVTI